MTPASFSSSAGCDAGQRRADVALADHRLDLRRRPVGDDAPVRHQDGAVRELVRLLEVVRREDHGLAVRGEVAHRRPERAPRLDVHRHRRLVEDEQIGIADERDREARTLRLAAGELLRHPVGDLVDPRERDRLVDAERPRVERRDHRDQLAHREIADQRSGLQHRADAARGDGVLRRPAEQLRAAGVRVEHAEQHVDRRRLARHRSARAARPSPRRDRRRRSRARPGRRRTTSSGRAARRRRSSRPPRAVSSTAAISSIVPERATVPRRSPLTVTVTVKTRDMSSVAALRDRRTGRRGWIEPRRTWRFS